VRSCLQVPRYDRNLAGLTAIGVADKGIKTTTFSIQPVSNNVDKKRTLEGYQLNNMASVTIRDVAKAGPIIDAVARAGGDLTRVESMSFTVDNPDLLYGQAGEPVVKDAMAKAQQVASLAGVSLGKPMYISESGGHVPGPM
jgi:hypothetical protein